MDFKTFSRLIMVEQVLFTLPFALTGMLFAGGGTLSTWVWAAVALVAARTAGMLFNRVIDADIDAKNPRTRDRLIPRGEVGASSVWLLAIVSSAILVGAAFMLNSLCFFLSIPAVLMLFFYSYFKRFSSSCHFFLGLVEAAAPVGGYIAVTGRFDILSLVLGLAIMLWIAGLDIVYALQDMAFDSTAKLFSIPSSMGKEKSLAISSLCYGLSVSAMAGAGILAGMQFFYWTALIVTGMIFSYQQMLARKKELPVAIKKIFRVNMLVSPVLFAGTFIDVFISN